MFNTCDYVSDINRFKQKVRSVTQLYEDNCFTCVDDNIDDCIMYCDEKSFSATDNSNRNYDDVLMPGVVHFDFETPQDIMYNNEDIFEVFDNFIMFSEGYNFLKVSFSINEIMKYSSNLCRLSGPALRREILKIGVIAFKDRSYFKDSDEISLIALLRYFNVESDIDRKIISRYMYTDPVLGEIDDEVLKFKTTLDNIFKKSDTEVKESTSEALYSLMIVGNGEGMKYDNIFKTKIEEIKRILETNDKDIENDEFDNTNYF